MKVVMLSRVVFPYHGYGGMQKYVYFLSKYLIDCGIDVEIVSSQVNNKSMKATYANINYTLLPPKDIFGGDIYSRVSTPIKYRRFAINAALYLRKRKFDVLHSYGSTSLYYLFLPKRSPTIVQTFGNEPFKVKNKPLRLIYYIAFYLPALLTMRYADSIASEFEMQSEEIARLYHVKKEKIFLLPDGVEVGQIREYLLKSQMTRRDIDLKDDDFVLISVGRLVPSKGVSYLIDALYLLRKKIGNIKLILIGKGPEEAKIKSQIRAYGLEKTVLHYKDVSDSELFSYYGLADVFITPTLFEGLPIVVLEAMACSLPIIASDIPGMRGVVLDGQNGFLVPPSNSIALAGAVEKIYDKDLARNMGRTSEKIVEDYDWKLVVKRAIKEYERISLKK